jgi:diguanylate cyclase (GGDEF)-like protein
MAPPAARADGTGARPGEGTAVVVVDRDGRILHASDSCAEMMGKAAADLIGVELTALTKPRDGELVLSGLRDAVDQVRAASLGRHWISPRCRPDVLVEMFCDPAALDGGGAVLALHDVTASYLAEQRRQGVGDPIERALEGVHIAVTRWSPALQLEYHSPEFESLVSIAPDLLLAEPTLDRLELQPAAWQAWSDSLTGVVASGDPAEFDWETADGRWIHSRAIAERSPDTGVDHVLVVSHDVTEERTRYEEMSRRALQDPLTGLPNRATFVAAVERSLGRRSRTATSEALIFVDLDDFKPINDGLGHAVGDEVIMAAARRLASALRPNDVVGRLGGDEFVVFLEQMAGMEDVLTVVERLRRALMAPMSVCGHELRISGSFGVAFALAQGDSAADLLTRADAAMYQAKAGGTGRVEFYDEALRQRAEQRMRGEAALRRAMGNGEMEVHFLPEFELATRRIVGAEALVRWRHPDRGLVPAAEFIALAEESGLLVDLGGEVLRRACELVADWSRDRPAEESFTLRVNVSPKQLAQPSLVATVERVLADTGLAPETLCLELAESTLAGCRVDLGRQLGMLRRLGVRVSIDDFGTASSSLALLKQLPVDIVTIDRSFVVGLPTDETDRGIAAAIVGLGHAFGIEVIAEGIDDEHQLEHLLELGCTRGQGYLLSPVLGPAELERRWL